MTSIVTPHSPASSRPPERQPHMRELAEWSETIAGRLAESEGIGLTEHHLAVVLFLREHYRAYGRATCCRALLRDLEDHFAAEGGGRYLYALFPRGPVSQASRIAGLPLPPHHEMPSFGRLDWC